MTHHYEEPKRRCVFLMYESNVEQEDGTIKKETSPIIWPDAFSLDDYSICEKEQLDPQLQDLGWKKRGKWRTSEGDSFGPLSRACEYETPEGELVDVWYG